MPVSRTERLLGKVFRRINRRVVWHRLPFWLAVTNVVALRANLRQFNLYDTERRARRRPSPTASTSATTAPWTAPTTT